jgi:hypothetical protein
MTQITREDFDSAEEYITALEEQNAGLKAKAMAGGAIRCKVSDKGGMSVYGLGRFPVTLYKSQWFRLLSHAEAIVTFLKENDSALAEKKAA